MQNRIKEIRRDKGMSQHELADVSGVARTTISFLENGKPIDIRTSTLTSIAHALGKPIEEIFLFD